MATIKYDYTFSTFYNEDDISYYLLGVFITDGCVYENGRNKKDGKIHYASQISSTDIDWLNDMKNKIGTNLKLQRFTDTYYAIRITRNELAEWLIEHNCNPRKTLTIKMPNVPTQYMPDFLRGCMDGDGSIGTYTDKHGRVSRKCFLISSSLPFLEEIQGYLKTQDIGSTIIEKKQTKPSEVNGKLIIQKNKCYALTTHATNSYKLVKLVYYPGHTLSLKRKNMKAQEIIDFYESGQILDKRKLRPLNVGCKIQWPTNEDLLALIENSNIEQLGKVLGVHPSAIRNRLKTRGLYHMVKKANMKITKEQREQIRIDFQNKKYSRKELAELYNVSKTTIKDIINNKY